MDGRTTTTTRVSRDGNATAKKRQKANDRLFLFNLLSIIPFIFNSFSCSFFIFFF